MIYSVFDRSCGAQAARGALGGHPVNASCSCETSGSSLTHMIYTHPQAASGLLDLFAHATAPGHPMMCVCVCLDVENEASVVEPLSLLTHRSDL